MKKIQLIEKLARKKGFVPLAGEWVKCFPGGNVWCFTLHGTNPRILDQHGREMYTQSHGVSLIGVLLRA